MAQELTAAVLARWRRDPIAFIGEALVNFETGKPFELYPEEIAFIREGFTPDRELRLPYREYVFGAPKKSGKTGLAAMCLLYVVICLGGLYAEGYSVANDYDQAQGRVFMACSRIIKASPILRDGARVLYNKIEFPTSGGLIQPISSDAGSAAGGAPNISIFDELWAYTSEGARRLWDEMVPVPTRKVSVRLTVTYAGFDGESHLLQALYNQGIVGQMIGTDLYRAGSLLMYWTHQLRAPWQSEKWRGDMRESMRPNAYLRLIENRWVSTESPFIPVEEFDKCVKPGLAPEQSSPELPVWVGIDAAYKKDSASVVLCTFEPDGEQVPELRGVEALRRFDRPLPLLAQITAALPWKTELPAEPDPTKLRKGVVRIVRHTIWQPTAANPLDFEETIEREMLSLRLRFNIRGAFYDPFQMVSTAQRLSKAGLPMIEFPQTPGNLTEASQNLYDLIQSHQLAAYKAPDVRLAVQRAIAVEGTRGWRIAKEKTSHKIDVVVALAQAALGAIKWGAMVVRRREVDLPADISAGQVFAR